MISPSHPSLASKDVNDSFQFAVVVRSNLCGRGAGRLRLQDAVPELPERAVTRPGDLWRLGRHQLLCGDATQRFDVERLMGGEQADLMFSDSPYNVDYEGYTADQGDRMNAGQFRTFLNSAFACYRGNRDRFRCGHAAYDRGWRPDRHRHSGSRSGR